MNSINVNIDLSFEKLADAVKKLSPKEKLLLNDILWSESMEIPTEHQALVLERIQKTKRNPNRLLDWDEAAKSLPS